MSLSTKYAWRCDGCDEAHAHNGPLPPKDWAQLRLRVTTGVLTERNFAVCGTCYLVLFRNRRTGPTWFQRLLKCLGGAS